MGERYTIWAPDKDIFMIDMEEAWKRGELRTWVISTESGAPNIITIKIEKDIASNLPKNEGE